MTEKVFSINILYKVFFFVSLMIFIMRQAIPMHDLFWIVWGLLQLIGVLSILKNRKSICFNQIFGQILASKAFIIILTIYIAIDAINLFYGPAPILSISKYVVFVEGISYIFHAAIICHLCGLTHQKFLDTLYKYIIISAIIASFIALINYYMPIFHNAANGQISIIDDYNAFCRYYLFSYIVGFVHICSNKKLTLYKQIVELVLYSMLLCVIMLMSTSRRTLLTLAMFTFVMVIYYIIRLYKMTNEKKKMYSFMKKALIVMIAFFITGIATVQGSSVLINAKQYFNEQVNITESVQGGIEQTSERIDTDNVWGKRSVIWQEAINEIKRYNAIELLFGKGAGYATKYYESEPTETVIEELYGTNELVENSMHTHNYLLQDMMEGGIIKVIFSLVLTVGLGIKIIINVIKKGDQWFIPLLSLILIGTNIMISYSSGFIGDVYYCVNLLILVQLELDDRKQIGNVNR